MVNIKVGLILGGGLDDLPIFKNAVERPLSTNYGDLVSPVVECKMEDYDCAYVNRSGKRSAGFLVASKVNHRANVWALKEEGCSHIIGVTLDGSLKDHLKPGSIVIIDDFFDNTSGRQKTFHDGQFTSPKGIMVVPMIPAFNEHFRKCVIDAAAESGISVSSEGKSIVIDGTSQPTKMELHVYRQYDASVVSTCTSPEAILAKEAGMLYVGISLVTCSADERTTVHQVVRCSMAHRDNIAKLLNSVIVAIHKQKWDKDIEELLDDVGIEDKACKCTK